MDRGGTGTMWRAEFAPSITEGLALADLTTIRIGGPVRTLVRPPDVAALQRLIATLAREERPWRVIGGGSNLLAPDEPIEDVVIHPNRLDGYEVDGSRVRIGAGLSLANAVARSNHLGLGGFHVLAGIPGQVGGALVMNAGGRWGEIASVVEAVHVVLADGRETDLTPEEMSFAYRTSSLPAGAVVTAATFRLDPVDDPRTLKRESGRIIKAKNEAQPTRGWNFGCMFANPEGHSAGRLVHEAGLAGEASGDARISPLHGNFVENLGHARSRDVRHLIELAERRVSDRFGIALRREVKIWSA